MAQLASLSSTWIGLKLDLIFWGFGIVNEAPSLGCFNVTD